MGEGSDDVITCSDIQMRWVGSIEIRMFCTSASPSPGSSMLSSTTFRSESLMSPTGRETRIARFPQPGMPAVSTFLAPSCPAGPHHASLRTSVSVAGHLGLRGPHSERVQEGGKARRILYGSL